MLNYIEVTIQVTSSEQKELLIAELDDADYEGFEEGTFRLSAYIQENKFSEHDLESIMLRHHADYSVAIIEQKNWNEVWETSFEPVQIGDFCYIRAGFHQPQQGFLHEIIITPKMSFGTGHHATTYLMIEAMKEIDFNNKSVLDFGTGTGVLAILAEQLGAAMVDAIDIDEWSITNAAENVILNAAKKIVLYQADSINTSRKYDVILANINKNVILLNLGDIHRHLCAGGIVVFSGLLQTDSSEVMKAAAAAGFVFADLKERNNWVSLEFTAHKD